MVSSTTHHCPKKSKGGCRKGNTPTGFPYCTLHMTYCRDPRCTPDYPFLKGQGCNNCKGRQEREKKEKEEKRKAEDKAKEREEKEKREKAQARKPGIKK